MICPWCDHDNVPGSDECSNCRQDLTQLDRPVAHDRVERSLMDDRVSVLNPRPPVTLPTTATVAQAVDVMLKGEIGTVLLVDDDGKLAGIFSERDLLMKVAGQHDIYSAAYVREFMTPDPVTVRDSDTLAFALHKMAVGGYRHLPVVKDGKLAGMVSVRDMLTHITRICSRTDRGVPADG
jgi:CBS domain-containing protein